MNIVYHLPFDLIACKFNQRLDNWNVSNVESMEATFFNARKFNKNIDNWDVSKVENMNYMFAYALVFNSDLNNWNKKNLKTKYRIFYENPITFNKNKNILWIYN
jgi:surface protein